MIKLKFIETIGPRPTSNFEIIENERVVGFLQLRHTPGKRKELPDHLASHIYYEIIPEEQGKGYATNALSFAKMEAHKIGLVDIIVTCDESNIASKKIIEVNGGEFVDSTFIPSINESMLRYKIKIN